MRLVVITLFLIFCTTAKAWEVRSHYKDDSKFILILRGSDLESLSSTIREESRILSGINLGRLIQIKSDGLQNDIHSYLRTHYPGELAAALSSAGNMHNPKVVPLHNPFEEAIIHSSYVQFINKVLCKNGYEIEGASTEKFMIIESNNKKYFDAMTWLKVKQLTSQSTRTQRSCAGV